MKIVIVCIFLCLSNVLCVPFAEDDVKFVVLPLNRVRRQAWNLFHNDKHSVDVAASISKQLGRSGSPTFGGQVGYTHIPSGSSFNIGLARTPGSGTDLNAKGVYNIFRNKNSALDATAEYSRNIGGPQGTGKPNYGIGLKHAWNLYGKNSINTAAFISKRFGVGRPPTFGGQLDYTHIPSGSSFNIELARTPGSGTDLNAKGVYNIFRNINSALDATAEYSKYGSGKTNYGVAVKYEKKFK